MSKNDEQSNGRARNRGVRVLIAARCAAGAGILTAGMLLASCDQSANTASDTTADTTSSAKTVADKATQRGAAVVDRGETASPVNDTRTEVSGRAADTPTTSGDISKALKAVSVPSGVTPDAYTGARVPTKRSTTSDRVSDATSARSRSQPAAGKPSENPAFRQEPAPATPLLANAKLEFKSLVHDFGTVYDEKPLHCVFTFANNGTDTLSISNVRPSCGCTVADLTKSEYIAGESGEIPITFTPKGRAGVQTKAITVYSNDQSKPQMRLTISCNYIPLVRVEPGIAQFGNVKAGDSPKTRLLVTSRDEKMTIKSVDTGDEHLSYRVFKPDTPPTDAVNYPGQMGIEFALSPGAPTGSFVREVTIIAIASAGEATEEGAPTPTPEERTIKARCFATISGDITFRPRFVAINTATPNTEWTREIRLTSISGRAFKITDVKVEPIVGPGIEVEYEPFETDIESGYTMILKGNPGDHSGHFRGTLSVKTDLPEGPAQVTYTGVVRAARPPLPTPATSSSSPSRKSLVPVTR